MVNIVRLSIWYMVSKDSKRVMITVKPKTLEKIKALQNIYDMSTSQVVQMLVSKEYQERIKD